jgi:hypothetical protein
VGSENEGHFILTKVTLQGAVAGGYGHETTRGVWCAGSVAARGRGPVRQGGPPRRAHCPEREAEAPASSSIHCPPAVDVFIQVAGLPAALLDSGRSGHLPERILGVQKPCPELESRRHVQPRAAAEGNCATGHAHWRQQGGDILAATQGCQ